MMTDLTPCLLRCDLALAEAERLLLLLTDGSSPLEPELTVVRRTIASLRKEVERLRGMPALPAGPKPRPDWTDLAGDGSPWATRSSGKTGGTFLGGAV